MARANAISGPAGGLRAGERMLRGWQWRAGRTLVSDPVRCRRDAWYLARATPRAELAGPRTALDIEFLSGGRPVHRRCLWLRGVAGAGGGRGVELLGWFNTPPEADGLRVRIALDGGGAPLEQVEFHHISERDPKCHPLANVPRWSDIRPAFSIERVVIPASLASLAGSLQDMRVEILDAPASGGALARAARGAACILDPDWLTRLGLRLADVERIAAGAWVVVDLATMARLVSDAVGAAVQMVAHTDPHGIMSARVAYSDVPTRGFALQDVVPFSTMTAAGGFCVRAIRKSRAWRRYADDTGFATLLETETPWEDKHGDILSAIRPVAGGELLTTDLPWLVGAGRENLLAPGLAEHLLRMHVAAPIKDHWQYWNRWDATPTVVRDIAELATRYAPLRAARWRSDTPGIAHLGVVLPAAESPFRTVCVQTGRIDNLTAHDGVPPESMMILMKWLAREVREQTALARDHLRRCTLVWQFDTADGRKYAANYPAAPAVGEWTQRMRIRLDGAAGRADDPVTTLDGDEGVFGDHGFGVLDGLIRSLRRVLDAGG